MKKSHGNLPQRSLYFNLSEQSTQPSTVRFNGAVYMHIYPQAQTSANCNSLYHQVCVARVDSRDPNIGIENLAVSHALKA